MSKVGFPGDRDARLRAGLAAVRARIQQACEAAGRAADDVALLAVTKALPATDVVLLADLGLTMFGENRVQEATTKIAEVAALRPLTPPPQWHLVGRLQRNKVRFVAGWAARVESVDSLRLADALDAAVLRSAAEPAADADPPHRPESAPPGARHGSQPDSGLPGGVTAGLRRLHDRLPVLLQVSLDGDPTRGGTSPEELPWLADHVAGCQGLDLQGVMAVAPAAADPDAAFALLAEHAAVLRARHPTATVISAGMSGDLESAIRHGSTCVRVGTALVDERPLLS